MTIKSKYIFNYQFWRIADHFFGNKIPANRFIKQRRKTSALIHSEFKKRNNPGKLKQVDIVNNISDNHLYQNYIKKGIPVVIKGKANNWNAIKKWNPDWLLKNFPNDKISLFDTSIKENSSPDYEVNNATLKDLIDAMKNGDNSKYSRFNRILYDHPELLNDLDWEWLYNMRNTISSGKTFQVFIGGKNTKTTLHSASENNLFTQVYGKKHWFLYPPEYDVVFNPPITRSPYFHSLFNPDNPDFEKFPNTKYIQTWECELEAGDILYNPPSWWHHVRNMSDSIGIGFRWFSINDSLKMSFTQTLLTLFSRNPPIWYATKNRTNFAKIFKYMNNKKLIL